MDPACAECGGACCKINTVPLPPQPWIEGAREFLQVRGEIHNNLWVLHAPCPKQEESGACGIWEKRPKPCADSPVGSPECRWAIDRVHKLDDKRFRVLALLPKLPDSGDGS